MTNFDPYQRWLGIPLAEQPPHLYRLLGLDLFEEDPEVIKSAAENSIAFIKQNAFGVELEQSKRVLKELAAASEFLLSPTNKASYDRKLKIKLGLIKPKPAAKPPTKGGHRKSDPSKKEQVSFPKQNDQKKLNLLGMEISFLAAGVSAVALFSLIVLISMLFISGDTEVASPPQIADNKLPAEKVEPVPEATSKSPSPAVQKEKPAPKKPIAALPKPKVPEPPLSEEFTGQFTVRADSLTKELRKALKDVVVEVIYQPGSKKSERVLLGTITTDEQGQAELKVKLTPKEQTGRFLAKLTRGNETWERKLNQFPNELAQTLTIPVAVEPEYLNPVWMEQRLEQVGIDKLIQEYRNVNDPLVQSVCTALDLSRVILHDHPEALRDQLQARLLTQQEKELADFQTFADKQIHFRSEWPSFNQVGGPLQGTLGSHSRDVVSLAITPNGQFAVSGGDDRLIKIWDLSKQVLVSTIKGHRREVTCLAISSDGSQIISGSRDKTLKVWDFKSGKLLKTLQGHKSPVSCLVVSPDENHVVSCSSDNNLKFWDLKSGKVIRTITGKKENVNSLQISPDGKQVLSGVGPNLNSYFIETARKSKTIKSERNEFDLFAITPDGEYAISKAVPMKVWDLATGKPIRTLEKYAGSISSLTVSGDGNHVIAGTYEREVVIWDLNGGEIIHKFNGHRDAVLSLAVSPDDKHIISGSRDNTIKLWKLPNGDQSLQPNKHARAVKSVTISKDGKQAVSGADNELKVWDLTENKLVREISKDVHSLQWLSYLPENNLAISATFGRFLGWDLSSGQLIQSFETDAVFGKYAVTPDGTRGITVASIRKKNRAVSTEVCVLDLVNRSLIKKFNASQSPPYCLALSSDGKQLVTGRLNEINVWNLDKGTLLYSIKDQFGHIRCLTLSGDGNRALTSAIKKNVFDIKVWDLQNQKAVHTLKGHEQQITCLAVSPNGKQAVSGSEDQTLRLWDLDNGKLLMTYVFDDIAQDIAIGPDNKTMIVGGFSGRVHKLVIDQSGNNEHKVPDSGSVPGLIVQESAQKYQSDSAKKLGRKVKIINSLEMHFAYIPAGKFLMGSRQPAAEIAKQFNTKSSQFINEHPQHEVKITKPFYMGMHEVTIDDFKQFVKMTDYKTESERNGNGGAGWDERTQKFRFGIPNFSWAKTGWLNSDFHPVVNVSWNDAVNFCKWLSTRTKEKYRLPTEAEWEYVCRAGSTSLYFHGDEPETLAQFGNIWDLSASQQFRRNYAHLKGISTDDGFAFTAPVGTYEANAWSIYDMHGNVMEWCSDLYDENYYKNFEGKDTSNPLGPDSGLNRVLRGGNWSLFPQYARSAYRSNLSPSSSSHNIGFRVVLEIESQD